jgi:malate dehydrogenase
MTIGIIGSGNVGANTAFFLAERSVADVSLYDISDGLSQGKALDLMEAAPIRLYQKKIRGVSSIEEIQNSDAIVITAGMVRKPGMSRENLLQVNRKTITDLAKSMKNSNAVFIIASEPVDLLTKLFIEESGLPENKVMGLGGLLDATRLRYLVSKKLNVSMENITATVIGAHNSHMIPLSKYTRVSGISIDDLLKEEELDALREETKSAGTLIVNMAQRANAYYGPSAAIAELASSIVLDSKQIAPVSLMFSGQYGIDGVCMSLPAVIGKNGVERVLEPVLNESQVQELKESADDIHKIFAEVQ